MAHPIRSSPISLARAPRAGHCRSVRIRAAESRRVQIADAKRVFKKKDRSKELLRRELRTNFVFAAVSASEAYMTQVPNAPLSACA